MDVLDFKNNYLNQILEILSKEQKQVFLLGDFNINFWITMIISQQMIS